MLAAAMALGAARGAAAQDAAPADPDTRAGVLRQQREAKQQALARYKPNGVERAMDIVEDGVLPILQRDGIYAKLGSLTTGSGFAYGVGYRNNRLAERRARLDLWAAASVKRYWAMEVRARFPEIADRRVAVEAYARRHEYPAEDFFGLGPDSQRANQTAFRLHNNLFGGNVRVFPMRAVAVGGGAEYLLPSVGGGADRALPSTEDVFTDSEAPGLVTQPDFLRTHAFIEVDYAKPIYARRGGRYRIDFSHYEDRENGAYSFRRVDADLRQFISFFSERRVIALRAFASTSDADEGAEVPFYMMPTLGGNDSLRGFRDYRFRGPHALLLQGEYRFEIWPGLDAALFYDTGKVEMRRRDLDFKDLEHDYGFGFRFNTDNGVIMRVDAGFGSRDGKHLFIVFGGVF